MRPEHTAAAQGLRRKYKIAENMSPLYIISSYAFEKRFPERDQMLTVMSNDPPVTRTCAIVNTPTITPTTVPHMNAFLTFLLKEGSFRIDVLISIKIAAEQNSVLGKL